MRVLKNRKDLGFACLICAVAVALVGTFLFELFLPERIAQIASMSIATVLAFVASTIVILQPKSR